MPDDKKSKTLIVILSAPSGGGKSTIARTLIAKDPKLILSISATTRAPRPGEENGKHYFFKSEEEFKRMINNGELIEHAKIYGNYYGVPQKNIEEKLQQGFDILFDINFEGTQKIKQIFSNKVISIFILPPAIEDLRKRLELRGQDAPEIIEQRIKMAVAEIENAKYYDYTVTNGDFTKTVEQIAGIISKERAKR